MYLDFIATLGNKKICLHDFLKKKNGKYRFYHYNEKSVQIF